MSDEGFGFELVPVLIVLAGIMVWRNSRVTKNTVAFFHPYWYVLRRIIKAISEVEASVCYGLPLKHCRNLCQITGFMFIRGKMTM
jgi:hypothetical protein